MQTPNKGSRQADEMRNRQILIIAAVAFTALSFFFVIYLFAGPGNHRNGESNSINETYQPERRIYTQPNPPQLDLEITEQNPNIAKDEPKPVDDQDTAIKDGDTLSVQLDDEKSDQSKQDNIDIADSKDNQTQHAKPAAAEIAPKNTPTEKHVSEKASSYKIQVGAYSDKNRADKVVADLRTKGYKADIQSFLAESLTLYKVQMGSFKNKDEAQGLLNELSSYGYAPSIIPN